MNCPICKKKVVNFYQWGQDMKAIRVRCPNCYAALRWNGTVRVGCFLTLVLETIAIVFMACTFREQLESERAIVVGAIFAVAILGGAITYWLGGYELVE